MIELRALGTLAVVRDGSEVSVGGPRQRRLLAILLIHRNSVVSIDRLADAVFAGQPTDGARTTMRSYVSRIRRVIDDEMNGVALVTQPPGYSLQLAPDVVDIGRFEALLDEANEQLAAGDAGTAAGTFRAALAIWRGDAYVEFDDEDWAQPEAQRLAELRLVAEGAACRRRTCLRSCGRDDRPARSPDRRAPVAGVVPGAADAGPLPDRSPGRRSSRVSRRIGRRSPTRWASTRHRASPNSNVESSTTTRRSISPMSPANPCGATGSARRIGSRPERNGPSRRVGGVDDDVTLSILRDPRVDENEFVRTFDANANRINSLAHRSIVWLKDYWREPGAAYVVTRVPTGISMRDRLQRGPMERGEIEALVRQIGGALVRSGGEGRAPRLGQPRQRGDRRRRKPVTHGFHRVSDRARHRRCRFRRSRTGVPQLDRICSRTHQRSTTSSPLIDASQNDTIDQFVERVGVALSGGALDTVLERPNPFKGLRSFDESDAADFFGRDEFVDQLVDRVRVDPLTLSSGARAAASRVSSAPVWSARCAAAARSVPIGTSRR